MIKINSIFQNISEIPEIGVKRKYLFNKIGIFTIKDLLFFFPTNFIQKTNELQENELMIEVLVKRKIKKGSFIQIFCIFGDKTVVLNYFNAKFFNIFQYGRKYYIYGKFYKKDANDDIFYADSPKITKPTENLSIYSSSISNSIINSIINEIIPCLPYDEKIYENLSIKEVLFNLHNGIELKKSLDVLKYLEASFIGHVFKKNAAVDNSIQITPNFTPKFLPFSPNEAQVEVIKDIFSEISKKEEMKYLVFAEVGAGKTLIALISILNIIKEGYNCILLAPTISLAFQHFQFMHDVLSKNGYECLLYSSETKKKKKIKEEIANNKYHLIISTHAVLYLDNEVKNIGLIIIDEMQKFGVLQRAKLLKNASKNNLLMLSATPIPRTLSILLNHYLKYKTLNSFYKKNIQTQFLHINHLPKLAQRIIEKKAYWVMPSIDDMEDKVGLLNRYNNLCEIFEKTDQKCFFLHGKMKDSEKIEVLENFRNEKKAVLVSTTVIEIGIDISDADVIIIERANKFGLSQLHQLRGRVGRAGQQAYCILLDEHLSKKIQYMQEFEDGYSISSKDLELRGMGEMVGLRQHGYSKFHFLTENDNEIMEKALNDKKVFENEFQFFVSTNDIVH